MADSLDLCDDLLLIARFCSGDKQAGNILVDRHQQKLLRAIKIRLRKRGLHQHQPEEIAQEVWCRLLNNEGERLKRYDPGRAGFATYLERLARQLIRKRYGKDRTTQRELPLEDREPLDPSANDALIHAEAAEFMAALTHQESRCLHEKLLNEPAPAAEPPLSASNERVLRHRLQRKLRDHLDLP